MEAVGQSCPAGHDGCLSDKGKRLDPWGKAYEYDQSLNSALVRSAGPDQVLGSRDDLEVFIPAQAPTKR